MILCDAGLRNDKDKGPAKEQTNHRSELMVDMSTSLINRDVTRSRGTRF